MMKNKLYSLLMILFCNSAFAQPTSLRGLYIDHFSTILGNSSKEDSLLHYAQDSSFNYFAMYDLQALNLSNTSTANMLGAFIKRAKLNFGIQYVGAVGETYSSFQNSIAPFNSSRTDDNEKFNVFNLEFEFWTTSAVNPGGYYCTRYLQQANCSCDTSGGFKYFINQMHLIDSLAAVQQVISETYLGWFNQGQASQIQRNVDRILLHAYRTGTSSLFSYSKTRLQYLASNNSIVDVAPIFSSEPSFMGSWMDSHSQLEAYSQYKTDFDNDNSSWKQYINVLGYHWFDWKYMPKPVPGSFHPVISASGPIAFCFGDSVTLTATTGNSYYWSNGASTRSITINASGNYSCAVTLNSITSSTPITSVSVMNNPTASLSSGNISGGQMPLTAIASAGSGTISSYQWKFDNSDIGGATTSTFISVASGNYTVKVTNSYGCSIISSIQNITFNGSSCVASTPSGLNSTSITELSRIIIWDPGQTGDSIIVRYQPDTGSSVYSYIRMVNIGQSLVQISGLQPSTTYVWQVHTGCGSTSGAYSPKGYFTTGGVSTGIHPVPHLKDPDQGSQAESSVFKAYPNPASDKIQIDYESGIMSMGELSIFDIRSSIVYTKKIPLTKGLNKFLINTSEFGNGIYFISLKNNEAVLIQRIIIGH